MTIHYIEDSVQVYLRMDGGRWVVDHATVDGTALEPVFDQHPRREACDCDDPDGCEIARRAAEGIPLPTGAEMTALMREATA